MATLKAANVTKYDAGGSGDNYIADGYIKSVEQVWLDTYTATAVAIGSDDSIKIGRVPKGKKITDITVHLPALNPTSTLCTILLDTGATIIMTGSSTYFGAVMVAQSTGLGTFASGTADTMKLPGSAAVVEAPKDLEIYLRIVNTGGADCINTGGTIRSIIKYT